MKLVAIKADNVIFILKDEKSLDMIIKALESETGNCVKNGTMSELPNIYYMSDEKLVWIWSK